MEDREIYERITRLETKADAGDKALELAKQQLEDWYVTKEKLYVTLNRLTYAILVVALMVVAISLTIIGIVVALKGLWDTIK